MIFCHKFRQGLKLENKILIISFTDQSRNIEQEDNMLFIRLGNIKEGIGTMNRFCNEI